MSSRVASILGKGLASRLNRPKNVRPFIASFSTNAKSLNDPSTFVTGVTVEDLEKDAALAQYFAANFPEYGTEVPITTTTDTTNAHESQNADSALEEVDDADSPLNIRLLAGYKRFEDGTQPCHRLRDHLQLIPGIIYGSDPTQNIVSIDSSSKILVKTPWEQIQREMDRFTYHNFESRVYDLTVFEDDDDEEGVQHRVTAANVQHHPFQKKIYCCNYLRYFPGRPIKIPIQYVNEEESGALKRGGFVVPQNRHVSCIVVDGVPIPEVIEMDCTGLRLKDVIRVDRLMFPEGVNPSKRVKKDRFLVGTVFGRRADAEEEDA
mmetsp:Transcript_14896/g.22322  ORF Transcript_14896/g.22322 Transcript_14896/m.22322 type:complete len:321 (-) Transcript_14896:33-995(-)